MLFCVQLNPTIDRVVEVPHFAVGETLRIEKVTIYPLGKAISVALSAKTIGETPQVVSLIGEHEVELYEQFLKEKGITHQLMPISGRTRSNITIIDPLGGTTTHLRERGFTVSVGVIDPLQKYLNDHVKPGDVVLFSGSLPPGLPDDIYGQLLSHTPVCKARGLDTSGIALQRGMEGHPSFVKPNLEELGELFPGTSPHSDDVQSLVTFIERMRKQGISLGAITLGDKGSVLWDKTSILSAKVTLPSVVDTVGCGDAFFAGLAAGASHDWDLEHIARVATAAAGANALTPGAGIFLERDFKEIKGKVRVRRL